MFCHQYPTGTCEWSNPIVRELPGQRSLALWGGQYTARNADDCQHQGSWELGSMERANRCEPLINVVTVDKPKMLKGLNQKVRDRPWSSALSRRRHTVTGGQAEPTPITVVTRNVVSPSFPREGQRTVRSVYGRAGTGGGRKRRPPCNGADRGCATRQDHPPRKWADFPLVSPHERV